jgi:hypothetical protein
MLGIRSGHYMSLGIAVQNRHAKVCRYELMPWFNKRRIAHMLVPDDVLKNVLFIGTKHDGTFRPSGTGFIVIYEEHGHQFMHLITAEHVIYNIVARGRDVWCRANLSNGDAQEFPLGGRDVWTFHPAPGTTDVAVCPFNPAAHDIDYVSFAVNGQESVAGTVDVLLREKIGLGEQTPIVGLFRDHHGTNRNMPIIRVGNISMMQGEPVFTKYAGYTDAYLIEARSIGGLSGSPVFISMPPFRVVDGTAVTTEGLQYYLLGLVHGHFDIRSINEDTVVDADADTADRGSINTGIGIVIPVEKVLETLRHPDLISLRQQRADEFRNSKGATPDSEI